MFKKNAFLACNFPKLVYSIGVARKIEFVFKFEFEHHPKERTMTSDKSDTIVLLSKQDVMNIVTLFADKGNPEDGVEYQGNRYGIVFRDGHYRLYMFDGIALCLEHK